MADWPIFHVPIVTGHNFRAFDDLCARHPDLGTLTSRTGACPSVEWTLIISSTRLYEMLMPLLVALLLCYTSALFPRVPQLFLSLIANCHFLLSFATPRLEASKHTSASDWDGCRLHRLHVSAVDAPGEKRRHRPHSGLEPGSPLSVSIEAQLVEVNEPVALSFLRLTELEEPRRLSHGHFLSNSHQQDRTLFRTLIDRRAGRWTF